MTLTQVFKWYIATLEAVIALYFLCLANTLTWAARTTLQLCV